MSHHEDKDVSEKEKEGLVSGRKKHEEEEPNLWQQYELSLRDMLYQVQPSLVPLFAALVIVAVGWLVGYIWTFVAYSQNKSAECAKPLLTWLVVEGVSGIVNTIMLFAAAIYSYSLAAGTGAERLRSMTNLPRGYVGVITLYFIITLYHFAWFIVGTAWVFQLGRHEPDCYRPLYDFSWVFLTVGWAYLIFVSIVGCILSACLPQPKKEVAMNQTKGRSAAASNANGHANGHANGVASSDKPASAAGVGAPSSVGAAPPPL